jgi:hypothetical protein
MANVLAIIALAVSIVSACFAYNVTRIERARRAEEVEANRHADLRLSITVDKQPRPSFLLMIANEGRHTASKVTVDCVETDCAPGLAQPFSEMTIRPGEHSLIRWHDPNLRQFKMTWTDGAGTHIEDRVVNWALTP